MRRSHVLIGFALVFLLSTTLPAIGASPSQLASKALRLAKKADKRSKQADKRSKQALAKAKTGPAGAQGAQGAQGAPGPSTGPAGGGLSGTYPNPSIAAGAITTSKFASLPQGQATSTGQSVPDASVTPVDLTSLTSGAGSGGVGSGVTFAVGSDTFTVSSGAAGLYLVMADVTWAADSTGVRGLALAKNGPSFTSQFLPAAASLSQTIEQANGMTRLNAGDTVALAIYQTSGGPLSTTAANLGVAWLGP